MWKRCEQRARKDQQEIDVESATHTQRTRSDDKESSAICLLWEPALAYEDSGKQEKTWTSLWVRSCTLPFLW